MKIIVFVKAVPDTRIPLEYDETSRRLRSEGFVMQWNSRDRAALEIALGIKDILPETHITLVHIGPLSGERWIREGLALGSDAGMRIWEDGIKEVSAAGKAFIFSHVAEILGFDLIMAGDESEDTGSGQVGAVMACRLGLPCIPSVISLAWDGNNRSIIARKCLSRGYEESIRCGFPVVVTVGDHPFVERYPAVPSLLEALMKEIPCWDLARIGIPIEALKRNERMLTSTPLRFPRPRVRSITSPNSSLPAFDRILKLLEGSVQHRGGKLVRGDEDALAEELFRTLRDEGWLDHLRNGER